MHWLRMIGTAGFMFGVGVLGVNFLERYLGQADAVEQPWGPLRITADGSERTYPMVWQPLTRNVMGKTWPLTVDAAAVGCSRNKPGASTVLVVEGEPWAIGALRDIAVAGKTTVEIGDDEKAVRVWGEPPAWWAVEEGVTVGGLVPHKDISPFINVAKALGCWFRHG